MIIFIDDEPRYITAYVQAFELTGFKVLIISDIDRAWEVISSQTDEVDAIMLDVMMPPGRLLNMEDTMEGLRTGLAFLDRLKNLDERIPVVILTNANKKDFGKIPHQNCLIYEKKEIDPWRLVDKMSDMKRRKKLND
jgi:CheY-like chemotaxis protein